HPAGAGVWLVDVALVLQRRHVVADRGGRDPETVPLHQGPRAHRLLGGDVVLDDRAQHGKPSLLDHAASSLRHSSSGRSTGTPPLRVPMLLGSHPWRSSPKSRTACGSRHTSGPTPTSRQSGATADSSSSTPTPRRRLAAPSSPTC